MEFHPYLESGTVPRDSLWYVLPTCGESPSMRVGHTCMQIGATNDSNGYVFVLGGANPSGTYSDMYALDLDTFTWSKRECAGFAGRYEHTSFVASCEPSNIYVFGGADGDGNRNDVQMYNTDSNSWCTVETSGSPPQPRTFHNGVCLGSQLIVYSGGERGSDPVSDRKLHIFDVAKRHWSVLQVRGDAPKSRHGHVMAAVDNRVFLHGGMAGTSFFDDLHVLDFTKNSWFHTKIKSIKPSARAAHGSFVSASDLYVFGGMNHNGALSDMFRLNTKLMEWTKIEFAGSPPANRLDFACCTVRLRVAGKKTTVTSASGVDPCSASVSEQDIAKLKIVSSDAPPHECHRAANIIDLNLESNSAVVTDSKVTTDEELLKAGPVTSCETNTNTADVEVQVNSLPRATPVDSSGECIARASSASPPGEGDAEQSAAAAGGPAVSSCEHSSSTDAVVEVAVLLGGMDTQGEIFDDCMIMRLSNAVQSVK